MRTRQCQPVARRRYMLLPFCLFTFLTLHAQTYIQRIQQTRQGEGTVTIHQDAAIDQLVNGTPTATPQPAPTPPTPKRDDKPAATPKPAVPSAPETTPDTVSMAHRPYKTTGYRVQVFAGGNSRTDRQKAEQTGRAMEALFPGEAVYVHFYSPRWICRIGNYLTLEEAQARMLEIRQLGYPAATIVKGKIIATQ